MQLHAQLEIFGRFAIFAHAQIAGSHTFDGAVFVVEHFGRGETGEDFHPQVLGLLAQPTGEVGQADDVVAVVLCALWQEDAGGAGGTRFRQKAPGVVGHGLVERGTQFFPVGEEFSQCLGVHDCARQDVRTWLAAFFEHHHRDILAFFSSQLLEANGGRQTARATTDHDHVVFHGFAGAVCAQNFCRCHGALILLNINGPIQHP